MTDVVDYVYRCTGHVHAGCGYQLYGALKTGIWPQIGEDWTIRPWGFDGRPVQGGVDVATLRIRARVAHVERAVSLCGQRLRIGDHWVEVGAVTLEPLRPAGELWAPACYVHSTKVAGRGRTDLERLAPDLVAPETKSAIGRIVAELGGGYVRVVLGRRRALRVGQYPAHIGYAVQLEGLTDEASLLVQASRIAGRAHMGGGIFLPGRLPGWCQPGAVDARHARRRDARRRDARRAAEPRADVPTPRRPVMSRWADLAEELAR